MRTHVVLPEEMVAEVDKVAGKRGRSRFIEEAVEARLRRDRQMAALDELRKLGPLDPKKYPHWSTPEKTSAWVREQRALDGERLEPKRGEEV